MSNEFDNPKINATFIIEMMGKPKEHLEETLERLIEKLGTEKGVTIINKKIHEATKFKHNEKEEKSEEEIKEMLKDNPNLAVSGDIFTTFAEIDAEFDHLHDLLIFSFNYMPSNVEIVKPENFILKNTDIGEVITGIVLRLHRYDEVAKKLAIDKTILENNIKKLLERKK